MNTRSILFALIWAAALAFFGYLLVSAIPLVAPSADKETVVSFLENGRLAIVAFFAFLGGIVGLLQNLGVKVTDVTSEKYVTPNQNVSGENVEKYRAKLRETFAAAEQLKSIATNNRYVAIKAMSYRVATLVAIQFAFCHIACAGIQGVLQKAYPLTEPIDAKFFLVAFAQMELLLLCAFLIPYRMHAKFIVDTKSSSQSCTYGTIFRIGGLGVFLCGLISLVTLTPEQISTLLGNKSLQTMPILNMNYMVYLALTRLVLCPIVGILGSMFSVRMNSKRP